MSWDNTSFNLELNREEVEVVVVRILRPGSRKKPLLPARGWKSKTQPRDTWTPSCCLFQSVRVVVESSLWSISSSDLLLYFTRRSLGSGGLSVWAYAPITSDIMPFEAGDPEAPSKFWMGTLWKNQVSKEGRANNSTQSQISTQRSNPTQEKKHQLGKSARTGAMGAALVPVLQRVPRMGDEPRHILIKNTHTKTTIRTDLRLFTVISCSLYGEHDVLIPRIIHTLLPRLRILDILQGTRNGRRSEKAKRKEPLSVRISPLY
ncbi:hypothetical protein CPAR01_06226 [Colletotrichum paranaense]|uniref:Uncharacterized protein n=1 Tax=Colletotrichum paranaense TaxID=1914294 RepID=A0ABQ9STJ8_9PEZI|nr:uncharacterized protein CPAR01_06226 [Colletotrichum paranaense]KAK1542839.1 hypothetical protein CPAR01_06226 [Colletotrichum paranaense]